MISRRAWRVVELTRVASFTMALPLGGARELRDAQHETVVLLRGIGANLTDPPR